MIATENVPIPMDNAHALAHAYVSKVFGSGYFIDRGKKTDSGWQFMVKCQRKDMTRTVAIGSMRVAEHGVEELTADRIRDMQEIAEVQAAKERGKLARDEDGFVLRRHARIIANNWTSDNIGMKVGAEGGVFVNQDTPIWRFSVHYYFAQDMSPTLDIIDVDAKQGVVTPLSDEQIQVIVGGIRSIQEVVELLPFPTNGLTPGLLGAM